MINVVLADRIIELTERPRRLERFKKVMSNWKAVCITAILALTLKSMAEQLVMMILRHQ